MGFEVPSLGWVAIYAAVGGSCQKRGADAQFPSRFEVKNEQREENSIYSVVSSGSRRKG